MQRIRDDFLTTLEQHVPLAGLTVLEIGCGDGYYTEQLAARCDQLVAIDPDPERLQLAKARKLGNVQFLEKSAEDLWGLPMERFDVILFTLSLHHIPPDGMEKAINEAIRFLSPKGRLVFLEPGLNGSFFEAERVFDACDGDERDAKIAACVAMKSHPGLTFIVQLPANTAFQFSSVEDFKESMQPKQGFGHLPTFLEWHMFELKAPRELAIYELA